MIANRKRRTPEWAEGKDRGGILRVSRGQTGHT